MKRIVSISIGSSKRDHKVEAKILGEDFLIERLGTDGDKEKAIELIKELDGKIDAFGMGGIDMYLTCKDKRYIIKDSIPIKNAAVKTPMLDGTFLKDTLERRVVRYINKEGILKLKGKKVLITSALDRYGMAEAFQEAGSDLIYGDVIFALGIPIKIKSYNTLYNVARILAPILVKMPFEMLYPTGKKQEKSVNSNLSKYYHEADIIAGDFNQIRMYMPKDMIGKVIITNTVTSHDIEDLRSRGLELLITTTPEFEGRSFGTNVMEATIVAFLEKKPESMTSEDFDKALDMLDFKPRVVHMQEKGSYKATL